MRVAPDYAPITFVNARNRTTERAFRYAPDAVQEQEFTQEPGGARQSTTVLPNPMSSPASHRLGRLNNDPNLLCEDVRHDLYVDGRWLAGKDDLRVPFDIVKLQRDRMSTNATNLFATDLNVLFSFRQPLRVAPPSTIRRKLRETSTNDVRFLGCNRIR